MTRLSERDIETLSELRSANQRLEQQGYRDGWAKPMHFGGSDGSHHSDTMAKLFKLKLVSRRGYLVRLYKINVRGIALLENPKGADMPRSKRKPYCPKMNIDDPQRPGRKINAPRSIRNDPLARLHSRGQINEAQYQAGRLYQDDIEKSSRGLQSMDPSNVRSGIVFDRMPDVDGQRAAITRLGLCVQDLGIDGATLITDVLVHGMTMEQIGKRRGVKVTQRSKDYFARRFIECLNRAAQVYGLAQGPKLKRAIVA